MTLIPIGILKLRKTQKEGIPLSNKTTTLDITGMTCAACSNRIEKKLNRLDDVTAQVNLTTEKATIEYNADEYQPEAFVEQIKKLGYDVATENKN